MIRLLLVLFQLIPVTAFSQNDTDASTLRFGSVNWSPDGTKIIFSAIMVKSDWSDYNANKWRLYSYDMENGSAEMIDSAAIYGAISRDRKKIAYGKNINGNREIVLYNSASKKKVNLTNHPAEDDAPSWSPDGKYLAFNSGRSGTKEIYVMNENGDDLRQLTHSDTNMSYNPEFSPDGKFLVYYYEKGDHKDQIYLLNVSTGESIRLTHDTDNNYYPGWMDNERILFATGEDTISVMAIDSQKIEVIEGVKSFYARYSMERNAIIFIDKLNQAISLYEYGTQQKNVIVDRAKLTTESDPR